MLDPTAVLEEKIACMKLAYALSHRFLDADLFRDILGLPEGIAERKSMSATVVPRVYNRFSDHVRTFTSDIIL